MPAVDISVVIPTFNRGKMLLQAIDSVLAQSYQPKQIIIVNNGSEPALIPASLTQQHNITVYDIIHCAGPAQARNFGASLAECEYISFHDDDDAWDADYLEKIATAIEENDRPHMLVGRLDQLVEGKRIANTMTGKITDMDYLFRHNPGCTGQTTTIARQTFIELGGYDTTLPPSEDKSLAIELLLRGLRIIPVPEAGALMTVHDGERATDNHKQINGIMNFCHKYRSRMGVEAYLYNRQKIAYLMSGQSLISALRAKILGLIIKAGRVLKLWKSTS